MIYNYGTSLDIIKTSHNEVQENTLLLELENILRNKINDYNIIIIIKENAIFVCISSWRKWYKLTLTALFLLIN